MRILFVIGPAFSGKSVFIRREFPDAVKVNISNYNKIAYAAETNEELEEIAKNAQLYCMEELRRRILAAKEDDVIILEHQLLKKEGRAAWIALVRSVTDTPIECIVMAPTEETVRKMVSFEETLVRFHAYEKGKLELPDLDEGFSSITYLRPEFNEEDFKC